MFDSTMISSTLAKRMKIRNMNIYNLKETCETLFKKQKEYLHSKNSPWGNKVEN